MEEHSISVTEAARDLSSYIDRCHDRQMTLVLLKDGVPVARLVPVFEHVCTGKMLAEAVAAFKLSENESRIWQDDLKAARECLLPPPADPFGANS